MGLIFVPYIHESLRKTFHRGSSETTSEWRSLPRGSNTNESSYQSLEDLVRIYDDASVIGLPDRMGTSLDNNESLPSASNSNSSANDEPRTPTENINNLRSLRRPHTATPGATAVSSIDRRTVRLLEVLSAYYVRAAYDRARAASTPPIPPPPPTASTSSVTTSSPNSPSTSSPTGLGLLQSPAAGSSSNSNIVSRSTPARVPERFTDTLSRVYDAHRSMSSQTEEPEHSVRRRQFILRPDHREMSAEELRLSHWRNGPFTFHSNVPSEPFARRTNTSLTNTGPGLLGTPERSVDDLLQFVRRRVDNSSSASTSSSQSEEPSNSNSMGFRFSSNLNPELNPELNTESSTSSASTSSESTPQAFLWHNETRTNVTTHGCLRVIMRRHRGWEEQIAHNGFVEYWHYTTVQRNEAPGFELIRDGVARLPWPMLALAGLQTLRSFAYQINSVHHRDTPLHEYQGNVFDVILVPTMSTLGVDNTDQ